MQAANVKVENTVYEIELDGSTDYKNIELLEKHLNVKYEPIDVAITSDNRENTEEILPDCNYKTETDVSATVKNELDIKYEEYDVDIEENDLGALQKTTEDLPPTTDRISQPEPEEKQKQTKKRRICRQRIPVNYADHVGAKDSLVKRTKKLKNITTDKQRYKIYRCCLCRKRSPNDQAFLSHINTHNRDLSTVYRCSCGKIFTRKADHKCKSKIPPTELNGMYCEFCKKMFSNRFVFMVHAEQHIGQMKKSDKNIPKTYRNCAKKLRSKEIKIEETW